MEKEHIFLKLVLKKIGFGDIQIDEFTGRKILQKKIYLLQLTGVDLGFRYNWYIKGPYCPTLANETFALKEEVKYDKEFEKYCLNSKTEAKFELLSEICKLPDGFVIKEHEWLELLASLHYLKHIAYWSQKGNPPFEIVFKKLIESKPHFSDKRGLANAAWDRLDGVGLVKKKTLE